MVSLWVIIFIKIFFVNFICIHANCLSKHTNLVRDNFYLALGHWLLACTERLTPASWLLQSVSICGFIQLMHSCPYFRSFVIGLRQDRPSFTRRGPSQGRRPIARIRRNSKENSWGRNSHKVWNNFIFGTTTAWLSIYRDVSDITKAPEMLGGRVKTLHPAVHGGV